MAKYEILPEGSNQQEKESRLLVWPLEPGDSGTILSNVDPYLGQLAGANDVAIDLVRIAFGAFLVDRLEKRRAGFSRSLEITVQLIDPGPWISVVDDICDLLHWLSGDDWRIQIVQETPNLARQLEPQTSTTKAAILLSGGLDSLCGAVLASESSEKYTLISHWDSSTIIRHTQTSIYTWLDTTFADKFEHQVFRMRESDRKVENSGRARSFLYSSLGLAVAEANVIEKMIVPENGYTSLNPPLGLDRGGALSTKSTHPWTLHKINRIAEQVGIKSKLVNPYQDLTKGELLKAAYDVNPPGFDGIVANSISCSKLDGQWYAGGDPTHNCGYCVPCLVRRGAFLGYSIDDPTPYLFTHLSNAERKRLKLRRSSDLLAVRSAVSQSIDDVRLIAMGPFPDSYDIDMGIELCNKGLGELKKIRLP